MSLAQEGRSVRLLTRGDVQALGQTIQARPYAPHNVDIVDLDLEDLFLEYVKYPPS
jgi:hypothetical protein